MTRNDSPLTPSPTHRPGAAVPRPLSPALCPLAPGRQAFTLVEMLIAMVLTLLLITSIAQFYAIVGDSVKDGRAIIEMGGRLRSAVERLKSDLDLLTVTVVPWTDDGSASGYFEYFEGIANDYNANGNFTTGSNPLPIHDSSAAEDFVDAAGAAGNNSVNDLYDFGITNMIGDGDDFLAFTIRASGQPFTGRYTYPIQGGAPQIYTSQLAEVVWWVSYLDRQGLATYAWEFNEPRQLHRRQLLIRPDLTAIDNNTAYTTASQANVRLFAILQENDISLSIRTEFDPSGSIVYRIRPNSLADLTKREHRFGHLAAFLASSGTTPPYLVDNNFPHRQILVPSFSAGSPGLTTAVNTQFSFALQGQSTRVPGSTDYPGESPGEDVVLSNILAFDVQIYDPYARVWPDDPGAIANSTTALVPNDPGYLTRATTAGGLNPPPLLGLGTYVDLGYYRYANTRTIDNNLFTNFGYPRPYFADAPSWPPSITNTTGQLLYIDNDHIGITYDTWSLSYERDGVFQLNSFTSYGPTAARMDMQTNGLDDDLANGVDDAAERETVPPYSQPLRGLQVKIRLYEPGTRQVRQATVAQDFITE
jgi:type II secretory pathway pseudopilin PulG